MLKCFLLFKVPLRVQQKYFSGKSYQWQARGKKFRIGFVVCQQFTFKIRRFRFTAAQTDARERMTSKEELTPSGLSRFQLFTRIEQTTVLAFQGLSKFFYPPGNSVVTLKISETE